MLAGLVVFEVKDNTLNSNVVQMKKNLVTTENNDDWWEGVWNVNNLFTASGSNIEISEDGLTATFIQDEDSLLESEIELTISGNYVANSADTEFYSGIVYYVLPLSLFELNTEYTTSYDVGSNILYLLSSQNTIGYIKLNDVLYCDGTDAECYNYTGGFYAESYDGSLYIYHSDENLVETEDYTYSLSLIYSVLPKKVNNTSTVTEIIFTDNYVNYLLSGLTTNINFSEEVLPFTLDNLYAESHQVYTEWNSDWGEEVTGYDHYLLYKVSGNVSHTSNYDVSFDIASTNGTVLSYSSDGTNYNSTSLSDFNNSNNCSIASIGENSINCSIVVGYNLADEDSLDTYFNVDIEGVSGEEQDSASFSWNYTLEKEIIVEYPSGYNKEFVQTLLSDDVGVGVVNKIRTGKDTLIKWKVEPTAPVINNNGTSNVKAFNLFNLTNNGTTPYTISLEGTGGVIDSSYNSVVNPYTLTSDEYVYQSLYFLDDIEYDYVLNDSKDAYILNESDISTYTAKLIYVKIDNGDWEVLGSYVLDTNGNIKFVANDSRVSNNDNVTESNPIILPDNVTDIKVTYIGTKAAVYMGIGFTTVLKSSDNLVAEVNDLIVNNSDIVLKNQTNFIYGNNTESEVLTGTYLTSAYETHTYYGSSSTANGLYIDSDSVKYDSISYTDYVYEQVDFSEGDSSKALEYLMKQESVTFYELLPIGAILDGDVTVKTYGSDVECDTNVTSTENYNGTGRTMLKIDVTLAGNADNVYEYNNYLQSGYVVDFKILYSYLANQSYGEVLYKDMAYYSNGELTSGYTNATNAPSSLFSDTSTKTLFSNINSSNTIKNVIYSTESTTVDKITVTIGTYVKETKNSNENSYSTNTKVMEGQKYKYRLQYVFSSDYEEITNFVFVDEIESNYQDKEYFKGYLESIDTSYLNNLGVNTTIYYSTVDIDTNNVDISDSSVWSTNKPSDITKLTAIAISCNNYIFRGSDNVSPMVDINMIATNSYDNSSVSAYNNSIILYNYVGDGVTKKMSSSSTTVELEKATILLSATTSVGSGTSSNPAIIESSYSYELKLSNTSDLYTQNNISYEMILPLGVSIDINDISEISNNLDAVYGSFDYDSDSRVLSYTLSSLLPLEEKEFSIPVTIDYNSLDDNTLFNTQVRLTRLANDSYNGDVITLYNKLAVPDLEFGKYVDTLDTEGFVDEATVIIEKNETYSYRININNTSIIDAKNIKVVDNVPSGLTVVDGTVTNNGIYNSEDNTITWELDTLPKEESINLEYKVLVSDNISLGTLYKSSAHVSVVNPIDSSLMLYDEDTNIISTLYQIISNIKVTNNLEGNLADYDKEFNYEFEFSGDASHVGEYYVYNQDGEKLGTLVLDNDGKGSYSTKIKGSKYVIIKLLPSGIDYTIKQSMEDGYITSCSDGNVDGNYVVITGKTSEEKNINYTYVNSYFASTSVDLSSKVIYDKEMSANMFALNITDNNGYSDTKYIDSDGNIEFDTIKYDNVVGTFKYTVSQVNTGVKKVGYDTNTYTVVVNVTDDGKGNLSKEVKYYNKLNEEVNEIVFNNEYVPNGLIINNVNTSDYVDTSKEFKYTLEITDSIDSVGSYVVKDTEGELLEELVIDDTGYALYEFTLLSDQKITIYDLPEGTNYKITQELVEYYTVTISDLTYVVDTDNGFISHSGIVYEDTIQVNINNNYVTSASYTPVSEITLLNKEIEDSEFNFMIKDVSEGLTNGYVEYISNNEDGKLEFTTINYNKPGTYVYEITQVKGESNHIYYDLSKCILTIVLTDNGDSTMKLESSLYEYESGNEYFVNEYSEEPIIREDTIIEGSNPNTDGNIGKFAIIVGMLILVIILFVIEKELRNKSLRLDA